MKNSVIKHRAAKSAGLFPIILFSVFLLFVFQASASQAQISGADLKRFQYEFSAQAYKQYADAVVYVTGEFSDPKRKELKEFFILPGQKSTDSIGTGFFISRSSSGEQEAYESPSFVAFLSHRFKNFLPGNFGLVNLPLFRYHVAFIEE